MAYKLADVSTYIVVINILSSKKKANAPNDNIATDLKIKIPSDQEIIRAKYYSLDLCSSNKS